MQPDLLYWRLTSKNKQMKKIILTLSLAIIVTATWSQARIPVNDPPPSGTTTKPTSNPTTTTTPIVSGELTKYSDPQSRFTISYPGNWAFNDKPENAVIKITSPKENDNDEFRQNVNLQIGDYSSTIEDYVSLNMSEVKKLMKGYREVSAMYFNRNSVRAYEVIYKGTYGEMAYEMQVKQLFVVTKGTAFILTYVSKVDERDAFETTANKIFNTFKY